jgi:autophagy-related protein 5
MVPRHSYLPVVVDKIQRHFGDFVLTANKSNEIWFDYNGTPLKWHYPVGLLYDLYANEGYESLANIPWSINVHFDVRKNIVLFIYIISYHKLAYIISSIPV